LLSDDDDDDVWCRYQVARQHGIPFLETSAKSNINVEKGFLDLTQAILNKVLRQLFHLILWTVAMLCMAVAEHEAQLSQRGCAMLRVIKNFAKSLKVVRSHSKLHR